MNVMEPTLLTAKPYLTEPIICQCCLNEDPALFIEKFTKDELVVMECLKCSFNFVPAYFRRNISYTGYKNEEVLKQIRAGNDWLKIQRHLLRYKLIRKYIRSGYLFDLGVGWGHFLLTGKQLGYKVYGIEISENPYIYSKEDLKLPVDHIDFFEMQKEKESFDIITMWDVLEHIDAADKVIEKCSYLMKPNGYLFIQVPQIDSFIAKRKREKWNMMSLDHVNYFSKKSIAVLLSRHGFEVKEIKSSIELKLFLMYTLLPWIKKLKGKKDEQISSAERQEYFNKTTKYPKWMLRIFVFFHNIIYNILSFFNIGEEMIVVAKKIKTG